MKTAECMLTVLLMTFSLSLPTYSQDFWSGNPIAEFLDPNTANAYHDFIVETVIPALKKPNNNNPEGDTGVTVYDPARCWNGYTLLSSMSGHQEVADGPLCSAILVDMEGNLVKEWPLTGDPKKLLPGGYAVGSARTPDNKSAVTLMDWDGNVIWQLVCSYHHDFQREGNPVGYYAPGMEPLLNGGRTLVLGKISPDPNLTKHISDFPLSDDVFWEFDRDGKLVWEWNAWKHFEQMGFDEAGKDAIKRFRAGGSTNAGKSDWTHANCMSWVGPNKWYDQADLRFHPDNIIFDFRSMDLIGIVARHDHPQGLWVSGDIVWRVGPNYSADYPEHKLGQIIGQHHAHVIPKGLPGAGNILTFDNGSYAGFGAVVPGLVRGASWNKHGDFSRVIEFDPITLDIVWEYRQQHPTADLDGDGDIKGFERKFFSALMSGAQRLENGNTMICEANSGRIFEVTREGDIVWEYISPYKGRIDAKFGNNSVYRAYRVPASWLPEGAVK